MNMRILIEKGVKLVETSVIVTLKPSHIRTKFHVQLF